VPSEGIVALIAFTANHTDHSNASGFQFEFHCDKCHNGYMSTFQASKIGMAGGFLRAASSIFGGVLGNVADAGDHVKDALRGKAWDDAFSKAVAEGKQHFKQCSRCGKWVCPEHCWNTKRGLCENCAPDLEEEASAAQATAAKEQVWDKARAKDQTGGLDLSIEHAAVCPHCGAKAEGGKFCPECGKPLRAKGQCPKCGAKVEANVKFCPECGAKV
jgi:hypothetical protein